MDKIVENAKIVIELARLYPEDSLSAIVGVLDMPVIDKNNAIWSAMEGGLVEESTDNDKPLVLKSAPEPLDMPELTEVKKAISYAMHRLAKDEQDLAEMTMNTWLTGYKSHFVAIALKQLLAEEVLTTYTLIDSGNKKKEVVDTPYLFYSLPRNAEHRWGLKMFKDEAKVREKKETPTDGVVKH